MKKIVFVFLVISIVLFCNSCNPEKIINSGSKPKTSNVVDENMEFSTPTIEEKGYFKIGEDVEDEKENNHTGTHLSYRITDVKTYNTLEDAKLSPDDILMYEVFCDNNGSFDKTYKLLLLSVDVHCSEKQENTDFRPNITRLSSVGIMNSTGIYEPISNEQIYFFNKSSEKLSNKKEYFYYDINKDETISVICGWMIPSNIKTEDLYLSIGTISYSSDGSPDDGATYISLNRVSNYD